MNNLCAIKNVCRIISDFEQKFQMKFDLSLNEGLLLCSLKKGEITSGELAQDLDLSCSNTSKVLRSVENKGFIKRALGEKDKRQMYFILSEAGEKMLERLEKEEIEIDDRFKQFSK